MSDLSTETGRRLPVRATYGIILVLIFGIALSLRVCLPYENVLSGDWVKFAGTDPWYHMRLVENLLQHFPSRISFDPYTFYPYGQEVFFAPFFDLLLGFVTWVIGLGSPSQHTIETVGAYFPAILGALVTVPVYFIGKELFNRNAGLLSAALIAILPGEFLTRSLLGFTDHHAAEVLFSAITMLFFILALKRAKEKETSFSHIRSKEWGSISKPLIYALLAGVALGVYLLSWVGGLAFVFILLSCMVLLYLIEHLRGKSTDYLGIVGVPVFIAPLIMTAPFLNQIAFSGLYIMSLTVATLTFPVLSGVSHLMEGRNIRRAYYPLALAGLGLVALGFLRLVDPSLFSSMVEKLGVFTPDTGALTISEARPLFYAYGSDFSLAPAWDRFTASFLIAPISLILIIYAAVKKVSAEKILFLVCGVILLCSAILVAALGQIGLAYYVAISLGLIIYAAIKGVSAEKLLFLVWSVTMLAATLGEVRFAYYLAVNVALLSGYFCWRIPGWISATLGWYGFREPSEPTGEQVDRWGKKSRKAKRLRAKEKRRQPKGVARYLRPRYVSAALAIVVVFFLVFYPNIGRARNMASINLSPNEDWHSALLWLGDTDNTPDPFQDADFYYELYERPSGEEYEYPPSAYGVMSWWDYGHWITAIAHRIPNSNPHQKGAVSAAEFFTAQDESSANAILDELDSRYVIIDIDMATPYRIADGKITTAKFYAMAIFAGKSESQFYEIYYREEEGKLEPVPVYYPEYYQSMCSRLYNFDGKQVVPSNSTWVISYTERDGYKVISTTELFPTYEEAKAYLESQTSPNYRIVGNDPFVSPVPLEKLEHYQQPQPIYHSDTWGAKRGDEILSYYVEIFEYLP